MAMLALTDRLGAAAALALVLLVAPDARAECRGEQHAYQFYFASGATALAPSVEPLAREVRLKVDTLEPILVVGHDSAGKAPATSLEISRRRAEAVARALGLPAASVTVTWKGAADLPVPAPAEEPLNRVVSVSLCELPSAEIAERRRYYEYRPQTWRRPDGTLVTASSTITWAPAASAQGTSK